MNSKSSQISTSLIFLGLALSLILVFAASAQGSPAYLVDGSRLSKSESIISLSGTNSLSVPAIGLTVDCKSTIKGNISPGGASTGFLRLAICSTLGPSCEATVPSETSVKGKLIEHGEEIYAWYEPTTGNTLATLEFKGAKCTLPSKVELTGSLVSLVSPQKSGELLLTLSSAIETLVCGAIPCGLQFGENSASLNGKIWQLLSSEEQLLGVAPAGEFTIEGATLEKLGLSKETIGLSGNGQFKLNSPSFLGGYGLVISCQKSAGTGTIEPQGRGTITFSLTNCEFTNGKGEKGKCSVESVKAEAIFLAVKRQGKAPELFFAPVEKNGKAIVFFTILGGGSGCPLAPNTYNANGTMVATLEEGEHLASSLTFSKATMEQHPEYGLTFGVFPMFLEGGTSLQLSGAHLLSSWGVI